MKNTAKYFNDNYQSTGVTFGGTTISFRTSQSFASTKYPDCTYHFEFWQNKDALYACLHTDHKSDKINLINLIQSYTPLLLGRLSKKFPGPPYLHTTLVGVAKNPQSLAINLEVQRGLTTPNAKFSSEVMTDIINFVQNTIKL